MAAKLPTAQDPPVWIGSWLRDLKTFPEDVQDAIGYALYVVQTGGKHPAAKPLKGGGGLKGTGVWGGR